MSLDRAPPDPDAGGLRSVGPFDPGPLACLHARCFDVGWSEESFARLLAGPDGFGFWMIEAADVPSGFVLARAAAGESEILTIAVDPAWRKRGVGRRLLETAMAEAASRGAAEMFLEVAENNEPALALYRRCRFEPVGRRREYYDGANGKLDALILRRVLACSTLADT